MHHSRVTEVSHSLSETHLCRCHPARPSSIFDRLACLNARVDFQELGESGS
jgi:hypothetical protein